MRDRRLKVVFMGTPYFAVPSLDRIYESIHQVVAVVTAPDKPAGRGMKFQTTAVKEYAVAHQIPVLQPTNLKDPQFIEKLKSFEADLFVIVAFRMLPEVVWNMPSLGSINLHGSLLPKYRGAAPINWAVINGEKETGVTTFFLKHEIDTGNIIMQESFPIEDTDTAGMVHDKMMYIGANLLLETLNQIANETTAPSPQIFTTDLPIAPKINKETGKINWNQTGHQIYNLIRGLQPAPAAYTHLDNKILKIHTVTFTSCNHHESCGLMKTDNKTFIHVYTSDGFLQINELQLEGKKRMKTNEFLRGTMLKDSTLLPSYSE